VQKAKSLKHLATISHQFSNFGCSKKITNKARTVVNTTNPSNAAGGSRLISFKSSRMSAVDKALQTLLTVIFSILLYIPFMMS
jgi:hypothetical protein